jgi:TolB protein
MKKTLIKLVGSLLLAMTALPMLASAEIPTIVLNDPNRKPLPIAVTDFVGGGAGDAQTGMQISSVIAADLERSGLFRPIDKKAFIQTPESLQVQPRFGDWRVINAEALVSGKAELTQDGHLRVEFRLWDVGGEQAVIGQAYNASPQGWRRISHMIADAIYKRLTGEDGYFDTQIVYVAESGPAQKRVKRLAIMDQDGENHRFLTDGSDLVLTPRFSPNQREITYMSYYRDNPRVYVLHLDNGRREVLGDFPGMTFAPRFSPDGNKVIMSLAQNGSTNIYEMDLRTRHTARITSTPYIDTSPSYSPDGAQITFNSDRSGNQQLYVMDADGSNPHRISHGEGRYATPVWSPRGDLIAFTKWTGGTFYIGVMRPDGSGERLLTQGFLVEAPTWAPNGRVLAFWKQDRTDSNGRGGTTKLYTIDLTGFNERQAVTPLDASDPAWSPLIP